MKKLLFAFAIICFCSCKKTASDTKECYDCADANGNNIGFVCGKDKDDARKNYTGPYNGVTYTYGTFPEALFNTRCKLKQ